LKGKTVIITGGSSGIGKACAIRFAREGANIVITGRNKEKLQKTADELHVFTQQVHMVAADVGIYSDCELIIDETLKQFGGIDILINNAGISMRGLLTDTKVEVLHQVMKTNFWGTVYCTKLALPHILKSNGSIVGMSSVAGKKGLPGRSAYSASKFAIEGFLETLRTENLKTDLHVLIACPGFTSSEIRNQALGPDGKPQKESPRDEHSMMTATVVAGHIFNAIKHRKRDMILTLNGKLTIFLNKFFPAWVDRLVYRHFAKEPGSPFKN
jgi:dehydrogenase/reductase SDR family member 7B